MTTNSELPIKVKIGTENTLVRFPYLPEQCYCFEEDDETENDMTWLVINLADRQDTTAAQEQFLNANDNVIEYTIR